MVSKVGGRWSFLPPNFFSDGPSFSKIFRRLKISMLNLVIYFLLLASIACQETVRPVAAGSENIKNPNQEDEREPQEDLQDSSTPIPAPTRRFKEKQGQSKSNESTSEITDCYQGKINFSKPGPFEYTYKPGAFDYYLPKNHDESCPIPVIAFAMGTIMPKQWYTDFYKHFASHGIAVVVDPSSMAMITNSLINAINAIYSDFGEVLGDEIATMGHSQGGVTAINIAGYTTKSGAKVGTVIGLMPGPFNLGGYKDIAYLGFAADSDLFGPFTDPKLFDLPKIIGPKFYAKQLGTTHIMGSSGGSLQGKNYAAMATAWMSCHMMNNDESCDHFRNNSCSNFQGKWICDNSGFKM